MYFDFASNIDSVKINFILYNNFCILEDLLDLFDTSLDISLLVFCCIVLSVLGKVTLISRFLDLLCYFISFDNF